MVPTLPQPPSLDSFQRELARLFSPQREATTASEWWHEHNRSDSSLEAHPITRRTDDGTLPPPPRPPGNLRDAIGELGTEAPTPARVHELASRLSTRAAWEQGGAEVIGWLLDHDARPELVELFTVVFAYAPREGAASLLMAMHEAFARALLTELERGRRGAGALRALVPLAIPSRLFSRMRRVAGAAQATHGALARGIVRRTRRAPSDRAELDALVAAVHLLPEPA